MHHSEVPGWDEWRQRFGTEAQCAEEFARLRPRPPHPGQSATAGTLLSGTRVPLTVWFVGVWVVLQWRRQTSRVFDRTCGYPLRLTAREFHRQIGESVVDYRTAWRMFGVLRKLVVRPRQPGGSWQRNFSRYLMKPARVARKARDEARMRRAEKRFEGLPPHVQEQEWEKLPLRLKERLWCKAIDRVAEQMEGRAPG